MFDDNPSCLPPRYHHVGVPGVKDKQQSYLTLALDVALISLGQQRQMPAGLYAQEKACKQEEKLISKLGNIELDGTIVSGITSQAMLLLEGKLRNEN